MFNSFRPRGLQHARLLCPPLSPVSSTISQSLLNLMSIELVMPSNHLILCCPLLLLPSQGLFQWVSSLHQVAKVLELHLPISPSNEHSGLISFRIDWFDLLAILAIVINTVWYWVGRDKLVKWSRIRNTEISTHIKQINFNKWILPSQFRRWRGSFFFNVAETNRHY